MTTTEHSTVDIRADPSVVTPPPVPTSGTPGPGARRSPRMVPPATAGVGYLLVSLFVWWHVWSSHPTSTTTCGCGDSSLFTWFLAWPAHAISHGLNPLYSTALFHPTGVNLLSNTGVVGIGVVLAPVTWLFGPVATLNVALTLSARRSRPWPCSCSCRRWVTWAPAAFVGGLLYGFSPFILISLDRWPPDAGHGADSPADRGVSRRGAGPTTPPTAWSPGVAARGAGGTSSSSSGRRSWS